MKQFEQRLQRLEELSESIKNTDIPLEQALSLFEEGIKIAQGLEQDIDKIEGKIHMLMNNPTELETKPELSEVSKGIRRAGASDQGESVNSTTLDLFAQTDI